MRRYDLRSWSSKRRAWNDVAKGRVADFPISVQVISPGGELSLKNLQIGNAVPPVFGEIIARRIVESLGAGAVRGRKIAVA
jgi:hypothetical protein